MMPIMPHGHVTRRSAMRLLAGRAPSPHEQPQLRARRHHGGLHHGQHHGRRSAAATAAASGLAAGVAAGVAAGLASQCYAQCYAATPLIAEISARLSRIEAALGMAAGGQRAPSSYPNQTQVGGHVGSMRFEGDRVLKRLQSSGRGDRESEFLLKVRPLPAARPLACC